METIGFLSLRDFLAELEAEGLQLVRVQPYVKRETDKHTGLMRLHYFVLAQAVTKGDVLVARFHTGSAWQHEEEKVQQCEENNQAAGEILSRHLASLGYQVRPGIIAASAQAETLATTNLWKFEGGKLIARETDS